MPRGGPQKPRGRWPDHVHAATAGARDQALDMWQKLGLLAIRARVELRNQRVDLRRQVRRRNRNQPFQVFQQYGDLFVVGLQFGGVVCSRPDFAPVVVSSNNLASSNGPPTDRSEQRRGRRTASRLVDA